MDRKEIILHLLASAGDQLDSARLEQWGRWEGQMERKDRLYRALASAGGGAPTEIERGLIARLGALEKNMQAVLKEKQAAVREDLRRLQRARAFVRECRSAGTPVFRGRLNIKG